MSKNTNKYITAAKNIFRCITPFLISDSFNTVENGVEYKIFIPSDIAVEDINIKGNIVEIKFNQIFNSIKISQNINIKIENINSKELELEIISDIQNNYITIIIKEKG